MAAEHRVLIGYGRGAGLRLGLMLLIVLLVACAVSNSPESPRRIALLAPFEGRYRTVGYETYYAAQLALMVSQLNGIELLAVDDGGTPGMARIRAKAIQQNPAVIAVVVLGYAATDPIVLDAFDNLPVIIVGSWGVDDVGSGRFVLASADLDDRQTIPLRPTLTELAGLEGVITGGEILSLGEFVELRKDLSEVTVISGGRLPDEAYSERIRATFPFSDSPGLYSTLTYDAVGLLAQAAGTADNRRSLTQTLDQITFNGINGPIRFVNGYWQDMLLNRYVYDPVGELQAAR